MKTMKPLQTSISRKKASVDVHNSFANSGSCDCLEPEDSLPTGVKYEPLYFPGSARTSGEAAAKSEVHDPSSGEDANVFRTHAANLGNGILWANVLTVPGWIAITVIGTWSASRRVCSSLEKRRFANFEWPASGGLC